MNAAEAKATVENALTDIMGVIQDLQKTDTGKFLVDPETSEAIKAVLLAEKAIKQAKEIMVERFKRAAEEADPNFKGIVGNGVSATYKATGAAFTCPAWVEHLTAKLHEQMAVVSLPTAMVTPKSKESLPLLKVDVKLDSKALKLWQKANGYDAATLPFGTEPVAERKHSLSFTLSGAGDEEYGEL